MKSLLMEHVIGIPVNSVAYSAQQSPNRILCNPASQYHNPLPSNESLKFKQNKVGTVIDKMNKLGEQADNLANGIRDHVRLGPNITETVKGKLRLGVKILQVGGMEKIFKQNFNIREGEKLLKASQCYLSTTAGPIAGLLFISTDNVAFCSERAIKLSSPNGQAVKSHYKVLIPLVKIKRANESQNTKRPSQKYIEIVTVDNFDFWFMGFLNYRATFKYLLRALSQAQYLQLDQK